MLISPNHANLTITYRSSESKRLQFARYTLQMRSIDHECRSVDVSIYPVILDTRFLVPSDVTKQVNLPRGAARTMNLFGT